MPLGIKLNFLQHDISNTLSLTNLPNSLGSSFKLRQYCNNNVYKLHNLVIELGRTSKILFPERFKYLKCNNLPVDSGNVLILEEDMLNALNYRQLPTSASKLLSPSSPSA